MVGEPVAGAAQVIPLPIAPKAGRFERAIVGSVVAELLAAELWRRTTAQELGQAAVSPSAIRTSPTRSMLSRSKGCRKTKITSPTPVRRYPSRYAATSAGEPPTVSSRSVPSAPTRSTRPWRSAIGVQASSAKAAAVAHDRVDRYGPFDPFERAADLIAARAKHVGHLRDPVGSP